MLAVVHAQGAHQGAPVAGFKGSERWVQHEAPFVMTREIGALHSTFEALKQATFFSDAQMCALLHKHPVALAYGPERVLGTLQAVSILAGIPVTSCSFGEVVLVASNRLFS